MFGLAQITGLVYFVFIVITGLFILGWLTFGFVLLGYKRRKTALEPRKLLRKMLDDNDFQDVNIGERKRIIKARNFSKISNAVVIRQNDYKDQSIAKIYDIIFHFYYVYNKKTKESKSFFWLKFLSWFLVFDLFLFIGTTILVVLTQFLKDSDVINGMGIAIQVLSIMGIIFLILGWFCWINLVEHYRQDLITLATEYLSDKDLKTFKIYTSFKAFFPFSENVICLC
ncbi:MAG: hypothetical protein EIB84_04645 [Spiroplasma poulsonii]|uniref:Uncharacterized protein n=1 Tax=Spiroplasma poulsonii TaxID=2138 RepID=A0A2P6FAY9_9MOLU|nr:MULTISPECIES: hypothetical protein [Spiroplasma]KAF0851765.1 putative transmembrane protein [Spiroplasma poulsonii]MBH8622863.1 hypothetical protein [Spiroplasma sp. hyd1]MBW1242106.1 hypothetical protein [Spiroplasma poulsonii]MBW3058622.1 hypothetical protein [Spiroplasma poulsonii]PQM30554.1 hypothetical protein SMSRO_SF003230 [Spiroplasma poulsonii]